MIKVSKINSLEGLGKAKIAVCEGVTQLATYTVENDWSPSIFNVNDTGNNRNNEHFLSADVLGLDVDEGCSLSEALEIFMDYKHIITTSKSHQKEKNGVVCDRFRVILFPETTINSSDELTETLTSLMEQFPFLDKSCKDAARFFWKGGEIKSINETGKLVKVKFPEKKLKVYVRQSDSSGLGMLSPKTMDFLLNGAEPLNWNNRLSSAAFDMNGQGYSYDQAVEKLSKMNNPYFNGTLDKRDMTTIKQAFKKPAKIQKREKKDKDGFFERLIGTLNVNFSNILIYADEMGATRVLEKNENNIVKNISFEGLLSRAAAIFIKEGFGFLPHKILTEVAKTWLTNSAAFGFAIDKLPSSFSLEADELTYNRVSIELVDGPTPTWDDFISRCGANGRALMAYTWSIFEKDDKSPQYLFLRGAGNDGKGSYTEWLQNILGKNAVCALSADDPHWPAQCMGKRLGLWPELNATSKVMTTTFKGITGGDAVTITQKYEKAITTTLDIKFILSTNKAIEIAGSDAEKRRIILVDLGPRGLQIDDYKLKIKEETSAFLFKCKKAYHELYDTKALTIKCDHESFEQHSASFEDEFELLFSSYFKSAPGMRIKAVEVTEAITKFKAYDRNFKSNFKEWLERKKGVGKIKTNGGIWYLTNLELQRPSDSALRQLESLQTEVLNAN
jgi:hypothetical protein